MRVIKFILYLSTVIRKCGKVDKFLKKKKVISQGYLVNIVVNNYKEYKTRCGCVGARLEFFTLLQDVIYTYSNWSPLEINL